jgi:hypothetical protein
VVAVQQQQRAQVEMAVAVLAQPPELQLLARLTQAAAVAVQLQVVQAVQA